MKNISWQQLDLNHIPAQSGVYGFKEGERWLYIGKAQNLSQRLRKRHIPLAIIRELFPNATLNYFLSKSPSRLENNLIRQLQPEWNGKTSWSGGWIGGFPSCDLPEVFKVASEDIQKAVSVIGW